MIEFDRYRYTDNGISASYRYRFIQILFIQIQIPGIGIGIDIGISAHTGYRWNSRLYIYLYSSENQPKDELYLNLKDFDIIGTVLRTFFLSELIVYPLIPCIRGFGN